MLHVVYFICEFYNSSQKYPKSLRDGERMIYHGQFCNLFELLTDVDFAKTRICANLINSCECDLVTAETAVVVR